MSVIPNMPIERDRTIELLLMQKFNAMRKGGTKNDMEVAKEAQRRLGKFRPEEVLNILYKLQSTETYYSKLVKREIRNYRT